ncbi:MAG TPA: hypothetical protein VM532_08835 [Burkholderiales bacterium]|jgi:hypothetical protein|nr:hypothetical protein [Burkholderiales bacterium]
MVTINNLEVRLDVEGEGDEAVFARLFEKYVTRWGRLETERKLRQRLFDSERASGDRSIQEID